MFCEGRRLEGRQRLEGLSPVLTGLMWGSRASPHKRSLRIHQKGTAGEELVLMPRIIWDSGRRSTWALTVPASPETPVLHVTHGHGIFFRNRSKLMSETFYVLTKSHPNKLFHFFPLDNTTHKSLIRACAHRELPLLLRKSVHLWILGFCRAISKGVFVDVLKHLATVHIFLAKDELITFK